MHLSRVVLILLVSSLSAFCASLDPVLLIEAANVCARNGSSGPTGVACANPNPPNQTAGSVTASGTETLATGVTITGTGFGEAEQYGVLRASSSGSFDITGSPQTAVVSGVSAFRDIITINFAPWNGQPGLLYVSYTLDGTISITGSAVAGVNVETYGGPTDSSGSFQNYTTSQSGTFAAIAPIPFVYGQPFNLGLELWTTVGTVNPNNLLLSTTSTGSGVGSADFSNTLILSGLTPTDANGNQAIGAQFSSASGTSYSVDGVVPEPASALLAVLGSLSAIAAMRARRLHVAQPTN
jgi:hypothetical protein